MGGLEEVPRSSLLPRWATQHCALVNKSVKLFIKYRLFHPVTQCAQTQIPPTGRTPKLLQVSASGVIRKLTFNLSFVSSLFSLYFFLSDLFPAG